MKSRRFFFESLEHRLVLDSVGFDNPFPDAVPFETLSDSCVASTRGVAQVDGQDLLVDVLFLVPPGANANDVALDALRSQGARPLQAAEYSTIGLVWDQFFDGYQDNDFVIQNYNPLNDPTGGDGDNGETALTNSHATWNAVAGSRFTFHYGGETDRWPSLVKESPDKQHLDGNNDVAWMRLNGRSILGVTWYHTEADEADMALNTLQSWSTDGVSHFDAETVFLHENGHVAGLGHSDVPGAVMEPFYDDVQRDLAQDDIDGIIALYPGVPVDVHDVAVVDIAAPSSVPEGETAIIDVTVQNQGSYPESFTVALTDDYDGVLIGTDSVTLAAGASGTVSFTWDTTGEAFDSHTLTAEATLGTDEDTTDNSLSTDVTVTDPSAVLSVLYVTPNWALPGAKTTVTVVGANFQDGASVDFGQRVSVRSLVFEDAFTLSVGLRIHPLAGIGYRDVTVTNPDGSSFTLEAGFHVGSLPEASESSLSVSQQQAVALEVTHWYASELTSTSRNGSNHNDKAKDVFDYLWGLY